MSDERECLRQQLPVPQGGSAAVNELETALAAARSEQVRLNRKLLELQTALTRYRELFNHTPMPCVALDQAGTVMTCNPATSHLLGQPRESIEGRLLQQFVDDESQSILRDHLRQCRRSKHAACSDIRLVGADGNPLPVEIRTHHRPGAMVPFISSLMALSDRKRVEAQRLHPAEAAPHVTEQFFAALGHDLRAPLGPIANLIAVLNMRKDLPPDVRPMLEMMERNLRREVRLLDDLRDVGRIACDKLPLSTRKIDLHVLIRKVTEGLNNRYRQAKVTVQLEPQAARSRIDADPDRMQQAFSTLLGNALEFTPPGGRVNVRTFDANEGQLIVMVEDTGACIESTRIGYLFTPFEQSGKDGHGGLGLAVARGVIEAHGGTIEAHSDGPGQGSTFVITLPAIAD